MKVSKISQSFYFICFIVILLGIFFRFSNIDKKVYWHDEVFTSLHISGFLSSEWKARLFTGEIIEPDKLQYYLQINPNTTLADTLNVLAVEDPHHPPFYYILLRYWRQLFGDSITVIRSFSSLVSLFIFPAIYWLCWELFKQPIVGLISICLISISPFYILYAQEAREYALWTVFIILSSAALLRGIKSTQYRKYKIYKCYLIWGTYSILITLSLYTSLFSLFVIISQIFYTFLLEKLKLTKVVIFLGISLLISLVLFIPWIIVFINNYEQYKRITSWTTQFSFSAFFLLKIWLLNISRIFFDVGWEFETKLSYLMIITCLVLVSYSLYFIIRNTPIKSWLFVISIMISQILCLLGPDLIFGGVRSLSSRYLTPFYIATDITVAYLLGSQLTIPKLFNIRIWSTLTIIVFSMGIVSCAINWQKDTAHTKVISYSLPEVARIINKTNSPLLVGNDSSYNPGNIMALSYLLHPDVKLQLLSNTENYKLPREFQNIFLLSPPDKLRETLEKAERIKITWVFGDNHLWLWKVDFQS